MCFKHAPSFFRLEHFQQKCSRGFVSENILNQYLRPLSDGKPDSTFPESGLGALAHKLGAQNKAFDRVGAAVDLFGVVGEADGFDHRAAL